MAGEKIKQQPDNPGWLHCLGRLRCKRRTLKDMAAECGRRGLDMDECEHNAMAQGVEIAMSVVEEYCQEPT